MSKQVYDALLAKFEKQAIDWGTVGTSALLGGASGLAMGATSVASGHAVQKLIAAHKKRKYEAAKKKKEEEESSMATNPQTETQPKAKELGHSAKAAASTLLGLKQATGYVPNISTVPSLPTADVLKRLQTLPDEMGSGMANQATATGGIRGSLTGAGLGALGGGLYGAITEDKPQENKLKRILAHLALGAGMGAGGGGLVGMYAANRTGNDIGHEIGTTLRDQATPLLQNLSKQGKQATIGMSDLNPSPGLSPAPKTVAAGGGGAGARPSSLAPAPSPASDGPQPGSVPPTSNIAAAGGAAPPGADAAALGMPNAPPAGLPQGSQGAAQQMQAAMAAEQEAQTLSDQAKMEGQHLKADKARTTLMKNQMQRQKVQSELSAMQQVGMGGGGGAQGAPAGGMGGGMPGPGAKLASPTFLRLREQIKRAKAGPQPAISQDMTVKLAALKLHTFIRKQAKQAALETTQADLCAMIEASLGEIPAQYIKQAFQVHPLSETPDWLVDFCMETGQAGRMADMITKRAHGDVQTEKVASGDVAAYRDVLRRGMALHNGIVKMASIIQKNVSQSVAKDGMPLAVRLVKMASAELGKSQTLALHQASALLADRSFRKAASSINELVITAGKQTLRLPIDTYGKAARSLYQVLDNPTCDEDAKLAASRLVFAKYATFRKVALDHMLDQLGAVAMVYNDRPMLARCLTGLAVGGKFGPDACQAAMGL